MDVTDLAGRAPVVLPKSKNKTNDDFDGIFAP